MAMKKNISKALAMAVMMSVWCGCAYAYDYVEIGDESKAEGKSAIAIGLETYAKGDGSIAIGGGTPNTIAKEGAKANGDYSIALGQIAQSTATNSVAIGVFAKTTGDNSVAIGSDSVADEANTFSVGSSAQLRKIVNVADGTKDTDAATVGQLKKKADQTQVDDHETRIKTLENGGIPEADLSDIKNGIIATNDRLDRVGATAAALAGINYQPMAKGQSQVAVGLGGYKGKKATAIGMAYQFSDRVSGSVAGATNGSEHMFNVGFNYLFGQHSAKDVAQMAAAPGSMSLKEAELQATVDSQNAKISNLENANAAMQARMAQLEAMVKALATKKLFKYYRAPKTRPQNSTPKLDPKKGCPQKTLDTRKNGSFLF